MGSEGAPRLGISWAHGRPHPDVGRNHRNRKRDPTTVTALTLSTSSAAALRADAVVVGVAKGPKGPVIAPGAEAVDKAFGGKLATVLETLGATGAEGEVTKLPAASGLKAPVVLAVGLGEAPAKGDGFDAEALRRAAGAAARALAGSKKGAFALPVEDAADAAAVAEGALLGAYAYDKPTATARRRQERQGRQGRQGQEEQRSARRGGPARRQAARQGVQGGGRARHGAGRRGQPRPRPDQHPVERARPGLVRGGRAWPRPRSTV